MRILHTTAVRGTATAYHFGLVVNGGNVRHVTWCSQNGRAEYSSVRDVYEHSLLGYSQAGRDQLAKRVKSFRKGYGFTKRKEVTR